MVKEKLHPSLQNSEFTLDDIVFPPFMIPDFEWKDIDLTTKLTERITLKIPLVSSPMDLVTEHRMAILMALMGGIGVIHYNFPTIDHQMKEVEKVRKFEAAFVRDPLVLGKEAQVGDVFKAAEKNGFFSYPITENGKLDSPMVGFVSRRDVRYQEDLSRSILEVMTQRDHLIVAHRANTLDINDIKAANQIIRTHNLDTLPIIDDDNKVVALVTDSDLSKDKRYPNATKDENKQLKVLVAVESRLDSAKERILAARNFGASGIVVDSRNIFDDHLKIAEWTKKETPELDVIIGNLVTKEVTDDAMAGVGNFIDALRLGIGGGEVCSTTEKFGIGRALASSLCEVSDALKPYRRVLGFKGLIADGGIKMYPYHIIGALMLGANAVMMGTELAGLDESPGKVEYDPETRRMIKHIRGMGSQEVIDERAGANRYMIDQNNKEERMAEGIKKAIPYKGSGEENITKLFVGVRQAMHGLGHKNIEDLYQNGRIYPAKRAVSKGTL